MSIYDADEEQQVEAIKDWWRENGKSVMLGLIIGVGGIVGWGYYQDTVTAEKESLSQGYSVVLDRLEAKGIEAAQDTQTFINSNEKSNYAVLAALQLAKVQVTSKQYDQALTQLKWAQSHTSDDTLIPLITHRIAKVLSEQGKYDEALSELAAINDPVWMGRNQELMGDVYLLKGQKDEAIKAYKQAQQNGSASPTLQIKIDDLA